MASVHRPEPGIEIVGMRTHPITDAYHVLLRARWWWTIVFIAGAFLISNLAFAAGYYVVGGVAHARPGSFSDAFFFSVQTMGTVGYGALYPESTGANVIVVAEAVVSLVLTAVATGLVFAKFQQSPARLAFSDRVVIAPYDGQSTLMFRVANERSNYVAEAQIRVSMIRDEKTTEGKIVYRVRDLPLARDRQPAFTRTWLVMHTIDEKSPLFGATPESLAANDSQITAAVIGMDDVSTQTVHARRTWRHEDILFDHYLTDMIEETPEGGLRVHWDRFHHVEPMKKPEPPEVT